MHIPKSRRPITPGDVLREDFVEPLGLTQGRVAKALGVDRTTINEIINGKRSITPDMALRLGHATRTTPEYWLRLQLAVDLFDALNSPARAAIAGKVSFLVP
jgi:addiction module HigA family antidote